MPFFSRKSIFQAICKGFFIQNAITDAKVADNITAGAATTAATLATARTINCVSFHGSANVTTLTAGTGISVSGTAVSIGKAVATSDDVTFADVAATGNVTITGNLDVNGTTTTLSAAILMPANNNKIIRVIMHVVLFISSPFLNIKNRVTNSFEQLGYL